LPGSPGCAPSAVPPRAGGARRQSRWRTGTEAADAQGNLIIADTGNLRVRVVAEGTGTFYGVSMNAGNIYTVAGDGKQGYSGDGGLATAADLAKPDSVAPDGTGLVVADGAAGRVRQVTG
jgi:hypothetical protein